MHYLVGFSGHKVPLAPYATFGTEELARNVADGIGAYNAVLLANHGLVAVGSDLGRAFNTAEEIELVARIYYQTKSVGNPVILPETEMERVLKNSPPTDNLPRKTAMFDFDRIIDRSGTGSIKWDRYAGRDVLPLWVADMDFPCRRRWLSPCSSALTTACTATPMFPTSWSR